MKNLDQVYFSTTHAPPCRLHPLAVKQNMPSIKGIPVWDDRLAKHVCTMLVAAKGKHINTHLLTLHAQGNLSLPSRILSLRVPPIGGTFTNQTFIA